MKTICTVIALCLSYMSLYPQDAQPTDNVHIPASKIVPRERAVISFIRDWSATTRSILRQSSGYISVGDKVGIGPLSSFVGYNTLEGLRLGAGISTLTGLSRRVLFRGSGAYGFIDHRWKYGVEAEWFITPAKSYFGSYPVNSVKFSAGYDTYNLAADWLSPLQQSELFRISLRRDEMILYRRHFSLRYSLEPTRQTSISINVSRERVFDTRYMGFGAMGNLNAWRAAANVGWTPGGDFYQSAHRRVNIKPYAPKLSARIQWIKGAQIVDKTSLGVFEVAAFRLTPLYRKMTLEVLVHGLYTLGHGRYPFLPALPSSPYVIRRTGAFALLRPLEIAAQRYVDLHARLDDGGIALSLLPPLRPLGISLTASFDMATGEPSGLRGSYPCAFNELEWSKPYCEAGIGLDHLLGIGRIEYVWRLSYRDIPDSRRSGVAVGIDYVF